MLNQVPLWTCVKGWWWWSLQPNKTSEKEKSILLNHVYLLHRLLARGHVYICSVRVDTRVGRSPCRSAMFSYPVGPAIPAGRKPNETKALRKNWVYWAWGWPLKQYLRTSKLIWIIRVSEAYFRGVSWLLGTGQWMLGPRSELICVALHLKLSLTVGVKVMTVVISGWGKPANNQEVWEDVQGSLSTSSSALLLKYLMLDWFLNSSLGIAQ